MIYIGCIAQFATGGTELLHQLAATIISCGTEAKMVYVGGRKKDDPVPDRFKKYNIPYTHGINKIKESDYLIVPEVMTQFLYKWRTPINCKKAIWWLSVDNYFESIESFKKSPKHYLGFKFFDFNEKIKHLTQSEYAASFLKKNGVREFNHLSDYLGDDFLRDSEIDISNKKDIIAYNPKKGIEATKEFINRSGNQFNFVALENMTPLEVRETLESAKVYIDFGHHPGKDRIPREAAMCGCCVITNTTGSAAFNKDVPIPQEYKFKSPIADFEKITNKIKYCINDFQSEYRKFQNYRETIKKEKNQFEHDVRKLLEEIGEIKK
ncbi:hypothetical protein [Vogesella indigofera]|uniref:hypothetical protein n=1 Tax=Vogesella indigofera TaxID=45465 RepID=UPI00234FB4EE|nr:hypothetical protein [Vogesella indigofera]MDC7711986.1 hypothetical protein [Vogesella indigofera]